MRMLMTTAEVGRRLGVTPATVRLMARRGELPIAVQSASGVRLFEEQAVEALRTRRAERVRATAGAA